MSVVCYLASAQDTYDTIYNDIGSLPCVRLLNATGFVGCQCMYWLQHINGAEE